jgi:hypothetical protein
VTWAEAEKDCNNKGGHLASIHSAAENAFIHGLWNASGTGSLSYLWIGGSDAAFEVGFTIYLQTVHTHTCIQTLQIQGFPSLEQL